MIPAKDISRYQGAWQDTGEQIVLIKMSGGDDGLYFDSAASANYNGAKASGRCVGGYHFIGWTIGAAQEASWFLRAMSPLAENDVLALDVEAIPGGVDPVDYTLAMVEYIHPQAGVYPLIYMNLATLNAYDWSPVLTLCGLWLADWAVAPTDTIPTSHTYVMQQYADGPNYDHDEWFGTLEQFNAYGYHATPSTTTTTTQVQAPPETTTTTTTAVIETTTTSTTEGAPPTATTTTTQEPATPLTLWEKIVQFFIGILNGLIGRK